MTESIITKNEDRERLIKTWERAYLVTQKSQRNFKKRVKELETWDNTSNEFERNCKIQALKNLIN